MNAGHGISASLSSTPPAATAPLGEMVRLTVTLELRAWPVVWKKAVSPFTHFVFEASDLCRILVVFLGERDGEILGKTNSFNGEEKAISSF